MNLATPKPPSFIIRTHPDGTVFARIPVRTVSEPNRRTHWNDRSKRAAAQKQIVKLTLGSRLRDLAPPVRVLLTRIGPGRMDDDNLCGAMKAVRDAVAAALEIDDGSLLIDWAYTQRRGAPGEYLVEILVARAVTTAADRR